MCFAVPVQLTTGHLEAITGIVGFFDLHSRKLVFRTIEITAITTNAGVGGGSPHQVSDATQTGSWYFERAPVSWSRCKVDRTGRQLWIDSNEAIRLVTGSVPILRGGKILFVSHLVASGMDFKGG
jgi:hypothetical protein